MFRRPRYFSVVFGREHCEAHPVEGGIYGHDPNFVSSSGIGAGDVLLLYCCGTYPRHAQQVPGFGVVTGIESDGIHYQYFPICHPVSWSIVQASIPAYQKAGNINWTLKGNFLREIGSSSFRAVIAGRQVDWP
jgi:hypothetical protein